MAQGTKAPNENIPEDPVPPGPLLLPGPPEGLTATWTGLGEITLAWTANVEATSYNIYYKEFVSDGKTVHPDVYHVDYIQIAGAYPVEADLLDTGGTLTAITFVHTGLTVLTPFYGYSYVVTSVNDNGESTGSAAAFAYTLPVPVALDLVATPDPLVVGDYLLEISEVGITGYTNGTVWDDTIKIYQCTTGDPGPGNFTFEYTVTFSIIADTFKFYDALDLGIVSKTITATIGDKVAVFGTNISGAGPSSAIETLA